MNAINDILVLAPESYVRDNPATGVFEVHRDVYRDPALFELEMRHVFEASWVFLAHETQIPQPLDYLASYVGRQPVLLQRDDRGQLGAFLNVCPHKGAQVCQNESGNRKFHVCPYHGWTFNSRGECVLVKDRAQGAYPSHFEQANTRLPPLARFDNYRGFLFGSINPDVPPLKEHLAGISTFLDMIVDQSQHGTEVIPGRSYYTYDANWKMQLENCLDAYHLTSTHPSFMNIAASRASGGGQFRNIDIADFVDPAIPSGSYTFKHGHAAIWIETAHPEIRPLYHQYDALVKRVGKVRADLMLKTVNFTVFPNLQFSCNACIQMRVMRPLAVDRTEMRSFCLGPKGEPKDLRKLRIHQFEDFFNPTGLATPDDSRVYESCQAGFAARGGPAVGLGHSRGLANVISGPDAYANELGLAPLTSSSGRSDMQDETVFHGSYREWLRRLQAGLRTEATA
ncbi:MAG: aromatic ring-hydroxylating oxygenase subunit alpha [Immundisolibacter sp.]|uniref:aromatic ring-hydroxylating oxygenase subunit alpha n=1 Tax=Immundisolibacter sp. TaxID=1934948 RepID=UPI003EE19C91